MSFYFSQDLVSAVGKPLGCAKVLLHEYEGTMDTDSPLELFLRFDEGTWFKISCDSDGESLSVNKARLEEVDLGEFGKRCVINASGFKNWERSINKTLVNVKVVVSPEKKAVGLIMMFENASQILVINLGDQLHVYNELPHLIFAQEKFELRSNS